jgi:hypothetical protein
MKIKDLFRRAVVEAVDALAEEQRAFAPHCDSSVLHAPSTCAYCDMYPEWQAYRNVARIAFTGQEPQSGQTRCPSEQHRSLAAINRWPGNRPSVDA